jgi:hypothetical protein
MPVLLSRALLCAALAGAALAPDLAAQLDGATPSMLGMLRMEEGIEVHVDLTFAPR